jgi:hypothetical protein
MKNLIRGGKLKREVWPFEGARFGCSRMAFMHFASRTRSKTTGVAELELKSVKVRNDKQKAVYVAGSYCA